MAYHDRAARNVVCLAAQRLNAERGEEPSERQANGAAWPRILYGISDNALGQ